jgi:hypothetical protein
MELDELINLYGKILVHSRSGDYKKARAASLDAYKAVSFAFEEVSKLISSISLSCVTGLEKSKTELMDGLMEKDKSLFPLYSFYKTLATAMMVLPEDAQDLYLAEKIALIEGKPVTSLAELATVLPDTISSEQLREFSFIIYCVKQPDLNLDGLLKSVEMERNRFGNAFPRRDWLPRFGLNYNY